jgi:hypothetical protein
MKPDRRHHDKPEDQVFIDRDGGNLLNVAVSRAQRSFILFGHSDLFFAPSSLVRENDLPSALLGRYLSGLHDRGQIGVKIGPKALVIVESAAKARIINEVLGSDYSVFGTGGHIRELADLDLNKAVLYPARLRLTPLILAIPGVNSYRLRLEAAETIERGFLKADPGAQAELLHDRVTWEQAQRVRAGALLTAKVVGEPTHSLLPRQTPDEVLNALRKLGLGRPSTYAEHIVGILTD